MRVRKPRLIERHCAHCGEWFSKSVTYAKSPDLYCAKGCASAAHWKAKNPYREQVIEISLARRRISTTLRHIKRMHKMAQPKPLRDCAECGQPFSQRNNAICCDDVCTTIRRERIRKEYIPKARKAGTLPRSRPRSRAKHYGVEYVHVNPYDIFKRDRWVCMLCGDRLASALRGTHDLKAPEIDHIIPISKGGPHIASNLQAACRACNLKKGARVGGGLDKVLMK